MTALEKRGQGMYPRGCAGFQKSGANGNSPGHVDLPLDLFALSQAAGSVSPGTVSKPGKQPAPSLDLSSAVAVPPSAEGDRAP